MKKTIKILCVLSFLCAVVGCTIEPPEQMVFGVPQSQWNQLTPAQQQSVIDGYNQRQRIQAENAPLESAIGAAQQVIDQGKHHRRPDSHPHWDQSPLPFTPPPM